MTLKIRRSPIGIYRFLAGGLLFLLPAPARAQLQGEVFAGYSYLFSGDLRSGGIQQNGWDISVAGNLARSLGVVADFSNHYRIIPSGFSTIGTKGKGFTFLFGPRYSFRNLWRLTPFAHMLFGAIQGNKLVEGPPTPPCGQSVCIEPETAFAMALGGGLDAKATGHIWVRLFQLEYLRANLSPPVPFSPVQNDLRFSTGIVFRFGKK